MPASILYSDRMWQFFPVIIIWVNRSEHVSTYICSTCVTLHLAHVHVVSILCLHMILLSYMLACRRCCPSPPSPLHWWRKCTTWNYLTCQWEQRPMEPPFTTARSTSVHLAEMKVVNAYTLFLCTLLMSSSGVHSLSNSSVQPLQYWTTTLPWSEGGMYQQ